MTDCNITANICVTACHPQCVASLLFVARNSLSRNGLIEPIETHLFREISIELKHELTQKKHYCYAMNTVCDLATWEHYII